MGVGTELGELDVPGLSGVPCNAPGRGWAAPVFS